MANDKIHVLVTGATGYIGKNLVKALRQDGYQVHVMIRKHSENEEFDLKERIFIYDGGVQKLAEYCLNNQIDTIIHLAAFQKTTHTLLDLDEFIQANILLGTYCLEALRTVSVPEKKFICVGTNWQHYMQKEYSAVNFYAATKEAFSKMVDYYSEAHGIRAITLEIYDTYSPFDKRPKIINLFKQLREGEVLNMSPGEQKLDMVYIKDIVRGFLIALKIMQDMETGVHKKYCLSSGKYYSIKEIVDIFEKVYDKKLNICFGAFPYKEREMMLPFLGGSKLPGWQCEYSLFDGMKDMKIQEEVVSKDE